MIRCVCGCVCVCVCVRLKGNYKTVLLPTHINIPNLSTQYALICSSLHITISVDHIFG